MASPIDIITLENFESKMPPWNPNSPNHLYALVDMGRFVFFMQLIKTPEINNSIAMAYAFPSQISRPHVPGC